MTIDRPEDVMLLARLGDALHVPTSEPSRDEVRALRMIVVAGPPPSRTRKWLAGLLAGGLVVAGGTAYAVASNDAPRPVMGVAKRIGLPVEEPNVTDVKKAEQRLEETLEHEAVDERAVADAAERLQKELADIDDDDRDEIDEDRAEELLRQSSSGPESATSTPSTTTTTKPEVSDDHEDTSGSSERSGSSGSDDGGSSGSGSDSGSGSSGTDDD